VDSQGGIAFFGAHNMPISTYIRFLNLILGEAEISLYIDGQRYFSGMTYGAFSSYTSMPPGIYSVALYRAGEYGRPIAEATESLSVGNSITLVATGAAGNIKVYQIPEPYMAPAVSLRSSLRVVNLSKEGLALDGWLSNGGKVFSNVHYTELSPYARLQPNVYTVTITAAGTGETVAVAENIYLEPGKIYSLYIVPSADGGSFDALFVADGEVAK